MSMYIPVGPPEGGHQFAHAVTGFNQTAFDQTEAGQNVIQMKKIYEEFKEDEMHPDLLAYWQSLGVKKELYNTGKNSGEHRYSIFTPLELDFSKKYALIYVSHGGMSNISQAEVTGFPAMVGNQKFICICAENGGYSNEEVETEFPRIIQEVITNGYPVDEERIYAAGYSAGSDATGVIASTNPQLVAAVSPDPGANLFYKGVWYNHPEYYQKLAKYRMPFICVGGTMDGGDRYPLETAEAIENFNIWIKEFAQIDNFKKLSLEKSKKIIRETKNPAKRAFGFNFDKTYTIHMEGLDWFVGDYKDKKHNTIARFVAGEGLPHEQTAYHSPIIWDYLKHFSRDVETGESIYNPIVIDGVK
ncbi:hypothetical protein ACYSNU_15260 [Enterococcus sp. LJL120]